MNSESEAIQAWLMWLFQDPDPTVSAPSGDTFSQATDPDEFGAGDSLLNQFDPLDSEAGERLFDQAEESNCFSIEESSFFEFGDKPAVQDRFHTVLKRRLRAEIERNPPRFPWESDAYAYEGEAQDGVLAELVPAKIWTAQLQNLALPIPLPEAVLTSLFDRCQAIAQSSLKEGVKLVQAVELLFPGQGQTLNQLAGMVLTAPTRSATTADLPPDTAPRHYESATPTQQMALALLAAREMIQELTLTVTPVRPQAERQWLSAVGQVRLAADYDFATQRLCLEAELPCGGSLRLQPPLDTSLAERGDAGALRLAAIAPGGATYGLEVQLNAPKSPSLTFVMRVLSASDY